MFIGVLERSNGQCQFWRRPATPPKWQRQRTQLQRKGLCALLAVSRLVSCTGYKAHVFSLLWIFLDESYGGPMERH
jgi:hypothetical protein